MVLINNMEIIITAAAYCISYILSRAGMYAASGILLMAAAAILAVYYCARYGRRINPPAVFALSWVGGSGIACLKLSYLETDWETLTWVIIYAAYACFVIGYKLAKRAACRKQDRDADIYAKKGDDRLNNTKACVDRTLVVNESGNESKSDAELRAFDGKNDDTCNCRARETAKKAKDRNRAGRLTPLYIMMNAIVIVSVISLIIEAGLLGYIPLFTTDTPHAYSYFHISGLHYFTVSCCLLPALGTLCIWYECHVCRHSSLDGTEVSNGVVDLGETGILRETEASREMEALRETEVSREMAASRDSDAACGDTASQGLSSSLRAGISDNEVAQSRQKKYQMSLIRKADIGICMGIGVLIPILLVSRYQLFFGILLAGFCMLILNGMRIWFKLNIKYVLAATVVFFILLVLYVFITIERAHSVEYLNGIFEMKYEHMPIFLSQPYIYIANNFDNLNCLVMGLAEHTLGLRMLFPFIALTGLKFLKPELAAFPIYVTKEELTTVTLIYDSYYDFGLAGVIVFCLAVGAAAALIERAAMQGDSDSAADLSSGRSKSHTAAEASTLGSMGEQAKDMRSAQIWEASRGTRAFTVLLYAQVMIYLCLAFFTTWLSNPTTWFMFGLTVIGMIVDAIVGRYSHYN